MPSTAEQIKNIILKHQDRASKQQIARELNLGLDYIDFVCREMERKGDLTFRNGYYLFTISKKAPRQRITPIKKSKPSSRRGKPRRQLVVARGKSRKSPNEVRSDFRGSRHQSGRKKGTRNTFLGMPKMTERLIDMLKKAGYKTIESLAEAPLARFMQETKLELHEAARLINQARKMLNKIGE